MQTCPDRHMPSYRPGDGGHSTYPTYSLAGFILEKVTRGGKPHIREILGGNMGVYEEGLFDLGGGKTFLREGQMPLPPPPPLKETLPGPSGRLLTSTASASVRPAASTIRGA